MKLQVLALPCGETTNVLQRVWRNSHLSHRSLIGDRRYEDISVVRKRDEASIEEQIRIWRQEEAILTVEPFLVAGISPRFRVARPKVLGIRNTCKATTPLYLRHS